MKPIFFSSAVELRQWFEKHARTETELLVGYYKVHTGKPSPTWSETVDEALCVGWIDGLRRSIDDERYCIRFTPRKPTSNWSLVNINKVKALIKEGRMHPEGLALYEKRSSQKSGQYSYEAAHVDFPPEIKQQFQASRKAWDFFSAAPGSYRKAAIRWVMTAKQEETRIRRLKELIRDSAKGERVKARRYDKKPPMKL